MCFYGEIRKIFSRYLLLSIAMPFLYYVGISACSEKNGGCTHLCLATPNGRSCQCPDEDDTTRPCLYGKIVVLSSPVGIETSYITD